MGRIVTYYCDRCGLTIPKASQIFSLFAEDYSREYNCFTKIICENCLNDLKDRWLMEGVDPDDGE